MYNDNDFYFNVPKNCKLITTKTHIKQMSAHCMFSFLDRDHGFLFVVSLDATGQFLI